MDIFSFWDNLPVVGGYFAGMPRIVKFILTAALVLVLLVLLGKMMSGKPGGTGERPRERERPKPSPKPPRHHRHRHEETKEEAGMEETGETSEELFGETGGSLDLLAGEGEQAGQGSIEALLSGKPITPEETSLESLAEPGLVAGEKKAKPEKKEEKQKKKEMPEESGPIGLPKELEEELEKEEAEKEKHGRHRPRKKAGKPVEFEEIKLEEIKPGKEKSGKKKQPEVKKEEKKGGLFGFLGGKKKPGKKLGKHDIMKMLDEGKSDKEILDALASSGILRGKAREMYAEVYKLWKEKRADLIQKKKELEEQKKLIQYKYLKMQIDEETFKKMMTDIQKKLVDVEAKLKATESLFKD